MHVCHFYSSPLVWSSIGNCCNPYQPWLTRMEAIAHKGGPAPAPTHVHRGGRKLGTQTAPADGKVPAMMQTAPADGKVLAMIPIAPADGKAREMPNAPVVGRMKVTNITRVAAAGCQIGIAEMDGLSITAILHSQTLIMMSTGDQTMISGRKNSTHLIVEMNLRMNHLRNRRLI